MKKEINDLIDCAIIGIVLGGIAIFGITQYQTNDILVNKINTLDYQLKSSERITDYTIKGITTDIDKNYKDLAKKIEQVPDLIKETKLAMEAKLKQVNVFITNKTVGATGSGVTLKYKGKFYVLSAGHMAENEDDELFLSENGQEICELEIVKHSYDGELDSYDSNDLILLRPKNSNIVPRIYVELADVEPEVSNELYIVGNPLGIEDVVSDARVTFYKGNFMLIKGDSYFGNSGGGIYTREGKLVGIMSFIFPIQPFPDRIVQEGNQQPITLIPGVPAYVINGVVRLDVILKFLEEV
jgi:S1-C subfamily serine protease